MFKCNITNILDNRTLQVSTIIKSRKLKKEFSFNSKLRLEKCDPKPNALKEWVDAHFGLKGYFSYEVSIWAMKSQDGVNVATIYFVGEHGVDCANQDLLT